MVKLILHGPRVTLPLPPSPPPEAPPRCRLLELPGELRNRIYRFTVVRECPVLVISGIWQEPMTHSKKVGRGTTTWKTGEYRFYPNPPPLQPELTSTCRTIRSEVLSLWYAENTFKIGHCGSSYSSLSMHRFLQWRKMLGSMAVHLRSLELTYEHEDYLGYTRTFNVSARIDVTGELDTSIVVDGASTTQNYYVQCCPCHLRSIWRKSKRQGRSGARLVELMRTYMDEHTGSRTEVDCKTCGLEIESHALI